MSNKLNSLANVGIKGAFGCDPVNSSVDQRNIFGQYKLYSNAQQSKKKQLVIKCSASQIFKEDIKKP